MNPELRFQKKCAAGAASDVAAINRAKDWARPVRRAKTAGYKLRQDRVALHRRSGTKRARFRGIRIVALRCDAAHFWKRRKRESRIDQCVSELLGSRRTVSRDVADDRGQIVDCGGGYDYVEAHESISSRASSAEMPSPCAASFRALRTPARNSISRAISCNDVSSGSL